MAFGTEGYGQKLVKAWTKLKFLDVSENKLKTLPAYLAQLPALKEIDAEDNYIAKLPKELAKSTIQKINLIKQHNLLRSVPAEFSKIVEWEMTSKQTYKTPGQEKKRRQIGRKANQEDPYNML